MTEFKIQDKVIVIATDEQLAGIGMKNEKVNNNLRKYESTITDELQNATFADSDDPDDDETKHYKTFVLDGTFTMPSLYLKLISEK